MKFLWLKIRLQLGDEIYSGKVVNITDLLQQMLVDGAQRRWPQRTKRQFAKKKARTYDAALPHEQKRRSTSNIEKRQHKSSRRPTSGVNIAFYSLVATFNGLEIAEEVAPSGRTFKFVHHLRLVPFLFLFFFFFGQIIQSTIH